MGRAGIRPVALSPRAGHAWARAALAVWWPSRSAGRRRGVDTPAPPRALTVCPSVASSGLAACVPSRRLTPHGAVPGVWSPTHAGDLLRWDNCLVPHLATFDYQWPQHRRLVQRITVDGSVPF